MKKVFALVLAVVMVLALTVTAMASLGGPLLGDESNVPGKAINASSAEVVEISSPDGEISRNTDSDAVKDLAGKLNDDEYAPYVFNFTPNPGITGNVTIENIQLWEPYEFLRVWYDNSGVWTPIGGQYDPITRTVTFPLPTGFAGGPIAITVVRTTGGGTVPVSPQTGEISTGVYLLGAAVMAAACAAFVMKSRKAA